MIHRLVSHNGQLLPVEEARLSPGQEGLINGWGLFTTLRAFRGRPFAFERHWRRLQRDAIRIHIPMTLDPEQLYSDVLEVIRANQAPDGAVRIYIVWNRTGMWHSDEPFPEIDVIITSAPLPSYAEPARLDLREHCRHAASPLAGVKAIAWLDNVWNLYEAKQRGFDEAVLLNERGEVAECVAANIFAAHSGDVLTPPLSSGCLAGITREVLLEIAPSAGIAIRETVLRPEDLYSADEVFLTSTNRALLSVSEIAGHKIPVARGAAVRSLSELFTAYMIEDVSHTRDAVTPPIAEPSGG
jgi:branched-chain amino acid aminotransferase